MAISEERAAAERECQQLRQENAALQSEVERLREERDEERDYFLNDIYEFGCCQFLLCAGTEDQRRSHGFIWQRICILKDAIKHGSRAGIAALARQEPRASVQPGE